jgi:gamma-glutamylcyclotransferase (GGCT)/AIG2-like uncharacterized protein YtfP
MKSQDNHHFERYYFFFYGTLRRGYPNFKKYASDALTIQEARTLGELYYLPEQGYPALLSGSTGYVYGEAMTFPDPQKALKRFDKLEEYWENNPAKSYYLRILKDVEILGTTKSIEAWCYVFPESRRGELERTGIKIPDGHWNPILV